MTNIFSGNYLKFKKDLYSSISLYNVNSFKQDSSIESIKNTISNNAVEKLLREKNARKKKSHEKNAREIKLFTTTNTRDTTQSEIYKTYIDNQNELKEMLANIICNTFIEIGSCNYDGKIDSETFDNIDLDTLIDALFKYINKYIKKHNEDEFIKYLNKFIINIQNKYNPTLSNPDKIFLKHFLSNICIYLMKIYGVLRTDVTQDKFVPIDPKLYNIQYLQDFDLDSYEYDTVSYDNHPNPSEQPSEQPTETTHIPGLITSPDENVDTLNKEYEKIFLLNYIMFKPYRRPWYTVLYCRRIDKILVNIKKNIQVQDYTRIKQCTKFCMLNPEYTLEQLLLLLLLLNKKIINNYEFLYSTIFSDYIPTTTTIQPSGGGKTRKNNSLKKYTKKLKQSGSGFFANLKEKIPWRRNVIQRDMGYYTQTTKKEPLLDRIFLKLCDKKLKNVLSNNTQRKGLLYKACNYIYPDKFKTEKELQIIPPQTNDNRKARERFNKYLENQRRSQETMQRQPQTTRKKTKKLLNNRTLHDVNNF